MKKENIKAFQYHTITCYGATTQNVIVKDRQKSSEFIVIDWENYTAIGHERLQTGQLLLDKEDCEYLISELKKQMNKFKGE